MVSDSRQKMQSSDGRAANTMIGKGGGLMAKREQRVLISFVNPNRAADFEKALRNMLIGKLAAEARQHSAQ